MPSQFFGLNIAYSGLNTYQAALNTTGNNIGNVQTKGYTRQEAVQRAADALRTNTKYGMAGAGVVTTSIEQIRDSYYDLRYWKNNMNLGEQNVKKYYMNQVENLFFDDGKNLKGFNTIFTEMYKTLAELQKNTGSVEKRAQFISSAGNLTKYFGSMATDLKKMQEDSNEEIKNKVNEINSLASELSTLNKQINVIETTGIKANELRDRRNLLIDQLSAIADIEVTETPVENSTYPDMETGAMDYKVLLSGQVLVDGKEYNTLSCVARKNKTNQSDADGLYDVKWSNGLDFNLYAGNLGGELQGLVSMRDGNNAEYFHGEVGSIDAANGTVTIKTSAFYLDDLNKSTLPPSGVIQIGNEKIAYTGWTYSDTTGYTFKLDGAAPRNDMIGKTTKIGNAVDYQGIPYYMQQLNEFVRTYAQTFNGILTKPDAAWTGVPGLVGVDLNGDLAKNLFLGNKSDGTQWQFNDTNISSTSDSYYQLTAANFAISEAIEGRPELLATAAKLPPLDGDSSEVDAYDITKILMDMKTEKNIMSFRGGSASEFLQCVTNDVTLNAERANVFCSIYNNISKSIDTQRMSISGVDNDEEGVNMIKFQNAYNLSSKMVQVLTEIYDRLILQTGV